MVTDSILYWLGIIAVVVTAVILVRKLLIKKENDETKEILKRWDNTNKKIEELTNQIRLERGARNGGYQSNPTKPKQKHHK